MVLRARGSRPRPPERLPLPRTEAVAVVVDSEGPPLTSLPLTVVAVAARVMAVQVATAARAVALAQLHMLEQESATRLQQVHRKAITAVQAQTQTLLRVVQVAVVVQVQLVVQAQYL